MSTNIKERFKISETTREIILVSGLIAGTLGALWLATSDQRLAIKQSQDPEFLAEMCGIDLSQCVRSEVEICTGQSASWPVASCSEWETFPLFEPIEDR